jgi:tetratricopeptide (TPR) repeat protein
MEAGEPKLRVVLRLGDDPDDEYELEELDALVQHAETNDQIRFLFERDRVGLAASAALTDEAHTMLERGKTRSALALLERATAIDPHDPAPHFETAKLEMGRQRWDAALQALRAVEIRAPGWPGVREDLALVTAIRDGSHPPALLTTLQTLEDSDRPVQAKLEMATQALESLGEHPRLWFARGRALATAGDYEDAKEAFSEAVECADEPTIETRALVALAEVSPTEEAAVAIARATELAGDPVATAAARLRLALSTAAGD